MRVRRNGSLAGPKALPEHKADVSDKIVKA